MATTTNVALDHASLLLVEEELRHLLALMNLPAMDVRSVSDSSGRLALTVTAPEAGRLLIGPQGIYLEALEQIVRVVIRRRLGPHIFVSLDVNSYRARQQQKRLAEASEAAAEAERTGRPVVLTPMSAADRRAIHTALANQGSVRTESVGEEPNRRVVIHPWLNQLR